MPRWSGPAPTFREDAGCSLSPRAKPCHTLVWEGEFANLEAAHAALDLFEGDAAHEELAREQRPYFQEIRIEFYKVLDM